MFCNCFKILLFPRTGCTSIISSSASFCLRTVLLDRKQSPKKYGNGKLVDESTNFTIL